MDRDQAAPRDMIGVLDQNRLFYFKPRGRVGASRYNYGNSAMRASANNLCPRASGWLMELAMSVM